MTATTQKPTLRELSPQCAAMIDKLRELVRCEADALNELHRPRPELGGISLAEHGRRQTNSSMQPPRPPAEPIKLHAGALELVGDLLPPPREETPEPPREPWPGAAELKRLGDEVEATREAIKLLRPLLAKSQRDASKKFCELYKAEYSAVVRDVVDACRKLNAAEYRHRIYLERLRTSGVSIEFLRPITTKQSILKIIDDAKSFGHLEMEQGEKAPAKPPAAFPGTR